MYNLLQPNLSCEPVVGDFKFHFSFGYIITCFLGNQTFSASLRPISVYHLLKSNQDIHYFFSKPGCLNVYSMYLWFAVAGHGWLSTNSGKRDWGPLRSQVWCFSWFVCNGWKGSVFESCYDYQFYSLRSYPFYAMQLGQLSQTTVHILYSILLF